MTHFEWSMIKSAIRIIGYALLPLVVAWLVFPAIVLIIAEVIGIIEEL